MPKYPTAYDYEVKDRIERAYLHGRELAAAYEHWTVNGHEARQWAAKYRTKAEREAFIRGFNEER